MYRQSAAELLGFLVDRPIELGAEMILDALAVGRQHAAQHAELFDGAPELGDARLHVLDWDQCHSLEARALAGEFFMKPVVVGAACRDRPMLGDKSADGEAERRIEYAVRNLRLVEKSKPLLGTGILQRGAISFRPQVMKMQVIQGRKNLRRAIAR